MHFEVVDELRFDFSRLRNHISLFKQLFPSQSFRAATLHTALQFSYLSLVDAPIAVLQYHINVFKIKFSQSSSWGAKVACHVAVFVSLIDVAIAVLLWKYLTQPISLY